MLAPALDLTVEEEFAELMGGLNMEDTFLVFVIEVYVIPFEIIPATVVANRRPSPKARSMRREGKRYVVRKDHGTTARRREIEKINARWTEGQQSPSGCRARRRERKLAERSGNPRIVR